VDDLQIRAFNAVAHVE